VAASGKGLGVHPALAEAVQARQTAGLARQQAEWMRSKARRECRRARRLRDDCRLISGRCSALPALDDLVPIVDEAELDRVFVVLEGLGADLDDDHSGAVRDRPHLFLVHEERKTP
jgi:hypothetical protein